MTIKKLGLAIATAASVTALAGCPTTGLPPGTGTGAAAVSGRVTFNGGNPGQALTLGLKKFDGSAWQKLNRTTTTDNSGNYAFTGTDLTAGRYQVFYDDQGSVVTDPTTNTVGIYNSAGSEVTAAASATIGFDVGWAFSPSITPNSTFSIGTSTFGFAANSNAPGAEYQIAVGDAAKSVKWSSAWASTTSFAWNGNEGSETNTPTGTARPEGAHFYLVKFRKAGTTFGGEGFYGQTKWVPFTLDRP